MDQQTDISIEILIHDDASTDGTDVIVREYTEKYPEIIFPIFEEENKYSRG
jgi:glycosyltransferase involved in cell wall biosynthesis